MSETRIVRIEGDTAADRIVFAWKNHALDQLSDGDKAILERITEVEKRFHEKKFVKDKDGNDTTMARPYKWKDLVEFLIEKYQISNRQAYADIELAKKFFLLGRTKFDKDFARGYRVDQGEELMHQAVDAGDFKSAAAFFKEIIKLEGLDRPDEHEHDPSKFQPPTPKIINDPSELGFERIENPDAVVERLKKSFKQGAIDKMIDDAEDIETQDGE